MLGMNYLKLHISNCIKNKQTNANTVFRTVANDLIQAIIFILYLIALK